MAWRNEACNILNCDMCQYESAHTVNTYGCGLPGMAHGPGVTGNPPEGFKCEDGGHDDATEPHSWSGMSAGVAKWPVFGSPVSAKKLKKGISKSEKAQDRLANYIKRMKHTDTGKAVADFYTLEALASQGSADAEERLQALEVPLSNMFAIYLNIATAGEWRHWTHCLYDEDDRNYLMAAAPKRWTGGLPKSRESFWAEWLNLSKSPYGDADKVKIIEDCFGLEWEDGYGGDPWRRATRVLRLYREGKISRRVFIDQTFHQEHWNGNILTKVFDMPPAAYYALEAQGRSDLPALVKHASKPVRALFQQYEDALEYAEKNCTRFVLPDEQPEVAKDRLVSRFLRGLPATRPTYWESWRNRDGD